MAELLDPIPSSIEAQFLSLNPPKSLVEKMVSLVKSNLKITYAARTTLFLNEKNKCPKNEGILNLVMVLDPYPGSHLSPIALPTAHHAVTYTEGATQVRISMPL